MLVERSPTPERSWQGESGGHAGTDPPEADWSLRERPATRHGQPRAASRGDPGPPQRSPFCGP